MIHNKLNFLRRKKKWASYLVIYVQTAKSPESKPLLKPFVGKCYNQYMFWALFCLISYQLLFVYVISLDCKLYNFINV